MRLDNETCQSLQAAVKTCRKQGSMSKTCTVENTCKIKVFLESRGGAIGTSCSGNHTNKIQKYWRYTLETYIITICLIKSTTPSTVLLSLFLLGSYSLIHACLSSVLCPPLQFSNNTHAHRHVSSCEWKLILGKGDECGLLLHKVFLHS